MEIFIFSVTKNIYHTLIPWFDHRWAVEQSAVLKNVWGSTTNHELAFVTWQGGVWCFTLILNAPGSLLSSFAQAC